MRKNIFITILVFMLSGAAALFAAGYANGDSFVIYSGISYMIKPGNNYFFKPGADNWEVGNNKERIITFSRDYKDKDGVITRSIPFARLRMTKVTEGPNAGSLQVWADCLQCHPDKEWIDFQIDSSLCFQSSMTPVTGKKIEGNYCLKIK